jgi:hypothetical protein
MLFEAVLIGPILFYLYYYSPHVFFLYKAHDKVMRAIRKGLLAFYLRKIRNKIKLGRASMKGGMPFCLRGSFPQILMHKYIIMDGKHLKNKGLTSNI